MSTFSVFNEVEGSGSQPFEIGAVDVYGTQYTKKIAAQTSLNAKVHEFMKSAKVQKLISEKRTAPKAILISKKEGFRLKFGENDIHLVAAFDDLENPSFWNRMKFWTLDYYTFRDVAGRELYEALNELEKQQLLSDARDHLNPSDEAVAATAPSARSIVTKDQTPGPSTIAWNHLKFDTATQRIGCFIDTNSAYRNLGGFMSKTVDMGTKAAAVTAMFTGVSGVVGGGLGVVSGAYGTVKNLWKANEARKIGDETGVKNSLLSASILASFGTVSGASTVAFSTGLAGVSAGAAPLALTCSGLVMGALLAVQGGRGIVSARKFSQEMDAILNSKKDEKERLIEALLTLKQKVTLTNAEYEKVKDDPEEIRKLMLKKGADFARSTNDQCLLKLLEFDASGNFVLDNLINGIVNQDNANAKIAEAKELLQEVYKANYATKVKSVTFLALGIITFAAFMVDYFFTGGAANFIFMIGAGLWLWVDSTKVGEKVTDSIWKERASAVLPDILKTPEQKREAKNQAVVGGKITGAVVTSFLWAPIYYFWLEYIQSSLDKLVKRMEDQRSLMASTSSG